MRLAQWQKDRIVDRATRETFKAREDRRKALEKELALKVYMAQLTLNEVQQINALPAKFFAIGGQLVAKQDGEGSRNYIHLNLPADLRVPRFIKDNVFIVSDEVWAEIQAWIDENKALAQDMKDFEQKTKAVVGAFSTSQKLLAEWPTLQTLMPAGFFDEKPKASVPAHNTIAQLDAALQAGRPFDTEKVAA